MISGHVIGSHFAGCRIEGELGRGGMGVVYRAVQPRLGRRVALKVIAPEYARDESFRQRFERESRHAASIDHPHVVPIYEADEADGLLYLVMRYVDGPDLRALIDRQRRLPIEQAATIVAQVAAALDCAHRSGLVHRDVKPGNVLVTGERGEEHTYLTDFGLTKRTSSQSGLTATGVFVGTVDYVAPEQVRGEPLDARADVYALACVLFHALTGEVPYPRGEDMAKMFAHVEADPPAPSELVPGLPRQFDAVIARGMAKERAGRYPSAGDLGRAALAAAEHQLATVPERSVAAGAAAPLGQDDVRPAARTEPERRPPRRPPPREAEPRTRTVHRPRRRLGLAVGVLAAAVVGLAAAVAVLAAGLGESDRPSEDRSPGADSLGERPLREGSSGPDVTELQRNLTYLNYPVPVDGKFGRRTKTVLLSYEQATDLTVDGVLSQSEARTIARRAESAKLESAETEPEPSKAVAEPSPVKREPLNPASPVTTQGVGPVLAGMTLEEAEAEAGTPLIPTGEELNGCEYVAPANLEGVSFMVIDGEIARADVTEPTVATLQGKIRVGASEEAVRETYGDKLEEGQSEVSSHTTVLTFVPDDPADTRLVFETDGTSVTSMRGGRLPEVEYPEGCA